MKITRFAKILGYHMSMKKKITRNWHINSLLILFIINRPSDNFKCQGPVAWPFSNFNHPSLVKSGLKKYLGFPRVFLSRTQICWKANVLSRDFWIKLKNNLRAKYCFIRFFFSFLLCIDIPDIFTLLVNTKEIVSWVDFPLTENRFPKLSAYSIYRNNRITEITSSISSVRARMIQKSGGLYNFSKRKKICSLEWNESYLTEWVGV